jgi:hypothetical protein
MNDDGGLGMDTVASNMPQLNYAPALERPTSTFTNAPGQLCNKVVL